MKILFVHQGIRSYVQTDIDLLRSAHEVRECYFPSVRKVGIHSLTVLPSLVRGALWCDATFSWFGKLHAAPAVLLAKMMGKKSVVVISGGEVCRFSLGPGNPYNSICTHPVWKWFPRFTTRFADLLLPVSDYAYNEAILSVGAHPHRMQRIYHGFSPDVFRKRRDTRKESLVVTVAELTEDNLYRKRLGVFVDAARLVPEVTFALVGHDYDGTGRILRQRAAGNVWVTGRLPDEQLLDILSKASAYVQASVMESFGCAVAEAMLCDCVPVVSKGSALPEVVGGCGIYLDDPVTPEEIARKVRAALQHQELGPRARERIIKMFSLQQRRRELLTAVASLGKDDS